MRIRLTCRSLALLPLVWLAGCNRAPQAPAPQSLSAGGTPTSVSSSPSYKDDLGRVLALKGKPQRIVVIGPGATEMLFALGAGQTLVGRDQVSDYPPAPHPQGVGGVPMVGDYTGPFPEKVIAVRPDLILLQGETWDKSRADAWQQKCNAPIAVLSAHTVAEVGHDMEKLGAWLGKDDAAHKLAQSITLKPQPPLPTAPRVFFEVERSPLSTVGGGTMLDDVLRRAGCVNVAGDIRGYKAYSLETLATKNPDFYVLARSKPDEAAALRELRQQPGLRNLSCIQKGHVIVLPGDWVERYGPRLGQGITALASAVRRKAAARQSR